MHANRLVMELGRDDILLVANRNVAGHRGHYRGKP
jgi:hypothetical protein